MAALTAVMLRLETLSAIVVLSFALMPFSDTPNSTKSLYLDASLKHTKQSPHLCLDASSQILQANTRLNHAASHLAVTSPCLGLPLGIPPLHSECSCCLTPHNNASSLAFVSSSPDALCPIISCSVDLSGAKGKPKVKLKDPPHPPTPTPTPQPGVA